MPLTSSEKQTGSSELSSWQFHRNLWEMHLYPPLKKKKARFNFRESTRFSNKWALNITDIPSRSLTFLLGSSSASFSGRCTTHWMSWRTRAVTIWMCTRSRSESLLFSLEVKAGTQGRCVSTLNQEHFWRAREMDAKQNIPAICILLLRLRTQRAPPPLPSCSLPEVSEVAFRRWKSSHGREDLFKNELPVLLVPREHLKMIQRNTKEFIGKLQKEFYLRWFATGKKKECRLTAVTSVMAHNCSSLTFSTKNGVIPRVDTWKRATHVRQESEETCREREWRAETLTWRTVVSVSSWISRSSEMLLIISHTLV